jgi:hypothetical protein
VGGLEGAASADVAERGDAVTAPARQAAIDAATYAVTGMTADWCAHRHQVSIAPGRAEDIARAAVSAAFAAVVPADLFIAPGRQGRPCVWRSPERDGRILVATDTMTGAAAWALLAALIPTREEA